MPMPITLASSGAAALINLWLAYRVTRLRFGDGILAGDGGNARLAARMRAHANFTEYTPLVLILIAAIEWTTGGSTALAVAAGVYILSRLLHPFGMDGWLPARKAGIILTWLVVLGLAVTALTLAFAPSSPVSVRGPVVPDNYRG